METIETKFASSMCSKDTKKNKHICVFKMQIVEKLRRAIPVHFVWCRSFALPRHLNLLFLWKIEVHTVHGESFPFYIYANFTKP